MIDLLNQHLADVLDPGLQAKQAHWNVKGPNFIGLHELFDKVKD
jgi:starvation-inducible DNA-binding protein